MRKVFARLLKVAGLTQRNLHFLSSEISDPFSMETFWKHFAPNAAPEEKRPCKSLKKLEPPGGFEPPTY